jgi:hypothetical protein
VAPGYLPFTIYSVIGSVSLTAMAFMSTQVCLVAVMGGSTTEASIAAAAFTFALKEGVGPLGGILFAGRYGQNFDEDIKKWRFMSFVAFNVALYIELMTLRFPSSFLLLASLANAFKNITFLLASASRASINVRFAKANNMGDISGKAVSQFTAGNLIGMGVGLSLSKILTITSMP